MCTVLLCLSILLLCPVLINGSYSLFLDPFVELRAVSAAKEKLHQEHVSLKTQEAKARELHAVTYLEPHEERCQEERLDKIILGAVSPSRTCESHCDKVLTFNAGARFSNTPCPMNWAIHDNTFTML